MKLLSALEKHIPSAQLLLEGAEARYYETAHELDLTATEFLCVFGLSAPLYDKVRPWLDGHASRRLVFVEENPGALAALLEADDAPLLLQDLRVKIFFLETPLQIEPLAKRIAWQAVFRTATVLLLEKNEQGALFQREFEKFHLGAHLLLSEASDWDRKVLQNARANGKRRVRSGLNLRGKFNGVPAVIIGAGPSLKKNGHLLAELGTKALLFAGGSALNSLSVEPHFAASIDKEAPHKQFKSHPFFEVPFCFQSRMNRDNFSLVHADALHFPDSGSLAIQWLEGEGSFDAGWTVGDFSAAIAVLCGCNPILFVGMDLCYEGGQKYAHVESSLPEGLVQAANGKGDLVWTQRDWLQSKLWLEELAEKRPDRTFLNATEGGLGFLQEVQLFDQLRQLPERADLRERVHAEIQKIPFISSHEERWRAWDQSLQNCLNKLMEMRLDRIEEEIVYQKLLFPLWQIWKPIFERELDLDQQPISVEEKLRLNQILFFQQVLEEHSQ